MRALNLKGYNPQSIQEPFDAADNADSDKKITDGNNGPVFSDVANSDTYLQSNTIYSQLDKITNQKKQVGKGENSPINPDKRQPKTDNLPKKKNQTKIASEPQIDQILHVSKVKAAVAKCLEQYPNRVDLQLKRFAELMEESFRKVTVKFKQQTTWPLNDRIDHPLRSLSDDVQDVIFQFLSNAPAEAQYEFFAFLWETFADSLAGGQSDQYKIRLSKTFNGIGVQILLALMARRNPTLILKLNLAAKGYTQLDPLGRVPNESYGYQLLFLFGQALRSENPHIALYLWFKYLLPAIVVKSELEWLQNDALSFAEILFKNFGKNRFRTSKKSLSSLEEEVKGFELLLDLHFDKTVKDEAQKRIDAIFRHVVDVTVLLDDKTPRRYFAVLFKHATDDQPIREVILELLLRSLQLDMECMNVWRSLHVQNICATHNLVIYVNDNLDKIKKQREIFLKELSKVVHEFISMNEKLMNGRLQKGNKKKKAFFSLNELLVEKEEIVLCITACKELERNLSGTTTQKNLVSERHCCSLHRFILIFIVLFVAIATLVAIVMFTEFGSTFFERTAARFGYRATDILKRFKTFLMPH